MELATNVDGMVCQKTIAEKLNLSQSTVSLALRGKPGVNKKTAAKVMALAEEMGYKPDPMLASLASYRSHKAPAHFRSVIPWLHMDEKLGAHREDLPWGRLLRGARERAERTGFKLEPHWVGGDDLKPERFLGMLEARGIAGVICGPGILESDWIREFVTSSIPIVGVGTYPLGQVAIPHVSADHYLNANRLARALEQEGCRKVLVILNPKLEKVLLRQYEASFRLETAASDRPTCWEVYCGSTGADAEAAKRMMQDKPDALVLSGVDQYREFERQLTAAQRKRFEATPVGLLCHSNLVQHPAPLISVEEHLDRIGAAAVDQLAVSITNWHLESRPLPRRVLVEGEVVRQG